MFSNIYFCFPKKLEKNKYFIDSLNKYVYVFLLVSETESPFYE